MSYFLYFYRRFLSILIGVFSNSQKLTAFCLLLAISLVISAVAYLRDKDRDENEPVFGKIVGGTLWLTLGLGIFFAFGYWAAGMIARILFMKRLGLKLREMAKYILLPYKCHLCKVHRVEPAGIPETLWVLFMGLGLGAFNLVLSAFYCLSLIGIPFGLRHFKLAAPAITPWHYRVLTDYEISQRDME